MLRRYLATLGAADHRIDDLIQEAFATAIQKAVEDRGRGALATWLRRAVRNILLRERRSTAARREVELAHEVWVEECGEADAQEQIDHLRHCLRTLPARSRALLHHAYARGDSRAEIATGFNLTEDGVKTALRRLRSRLRECLERRMGKTS